MSEGARPARQGGGTPPLQRIAIRDAERRDLEGVRALLVETWHDTYDPLLGVEKVTEITNAWHSVEALGPQLSLPDCSFLVAEEDGRIVGHVFANGRRLPPLYVSRVYVLPSFQRRGIGSALLAAAAACHPQAETIRLEVQADNPKGVAFYRREGFRPIGEHIEDGIPHIRMEKRLV